MKKAFPPAPPDEEDDMQPRGSMAAARRAWIDTPEDPAKGWRVVDVVKEHPTRPTVDDGAGPVEVDAGACCYLFSLGAGECGAHATVPAGPCARARVVATSSTSST